nr:RNA-directed DNA polymerase, eukaryota [Tanacetum cinerariifolium]
ERATCASCVKWGRKGFKCGFVKLWCAGEIFLGETGEQKNIVDLLSDIGLTAVKPVAFPLPTELKLSLNKGKSLDDPSAYRKLVGFTDADLASCLMTRRSLTGYCIFLGHSLVSWKTKKQPIISRSSTEAEYRAMTAITCELLWLSYLLQDLQIKVKLPVTIFCDNKVAQQIAANPCFHDRTKHLEIDCHFTRDNIQDGFLQTAYIPTHLQLADIMTKALGQVQHSFLADKKYWEIVGPDFCEAVEHFFVKGSFSKGCNSSFIALIPKVMDAKYVNDYRPISLIGSVYKVVTKIMANRLAMVIVDIVSDSQSAFVADRQILDGPFTLNEVLHWFKRKNKKAMFFKVDFAKAYDSVRWDYLIDVLEAFGFGPTWCKWIRGTFSFAKASVLVNGSPSNEFLHRLEH